MNMPCNDIELRESLVRTILALNPNYTKELVLRAIDSCCAQGLEDIENCAIERTKQIYLMEYNR